MKINFDNCMSSGPNHVEVDECNIVMSEVAICDDEGDEIDYLEMVMRITNEGIIYDVVSTESGEVVSSSYEFWNDIADRVQDKIKDKINVIPSKKVSRIWHVHEEFLALALTEGDNLSWPADYELIGTVESGDLDEVFKLANSIDHAWWENPECELIGNATDVGTARSLSVGDVVELPSGVAYRCMPTGWVHLKPDVDVSGIVIKDISIQHPPSNKDATIDFPPERTRKCFKVEYDLSYTGGNYDKVGWQFVYIPFSELDLIPYGITEEEEQVHQAFRDATGYESIHIVNYNLDESFTETGDVWEDI